MDGLPLNTLHEDGSDADEGDHACYNHYVFDLDTSGLVVGLLYWPFVAKDLSFHALLLTDAPLGDRIAHLRQALRVSITKVSQQLVPLAYNSLRAQARATAPCIRLLCVQLVPWIVHTGALDYLTHAVRVCVALRVALEDVIAGATDAAA